MSELVLVTGVGPGTGKAIVECFAGKGYTVAMLARSEQRLNDIAKSTPNTHSFVCDVADASRLTEVLAEIRDSLGSPKIVIHNAVGAERGTYLEVDAERMRAAFEINTPPLLKSTPGRS